MKTLVAFVVCCLIPAHDPAFAPDTEILTAMTQGIPPRPKGALTGSAFARQIAHLGGRAREVAILEQLKLGNVPEFLRDLKPIELGSRDFRRGVRYRATIWVMPDYLAVGSNDDFMRVPVGLDTAREVARHYGFTLPTRKMVDQIYRQSALRLTPQPMRAGPRMSSTAYYAEHNRRIEEQREGHALGELVSGHKKDVILTKRLWTKRGRVAIYGWHQRFGQPIQPLSTVHGARYADYSHGVRLVSATVLIDGEYRSVFEVLGDRDLARVLTYEGTIRDAAQLMGYPSRNSN